MFGKKKKKIVVNDVFGEMVHWMAEWESTVKVDITLWEKSYSVDLFAVARTEKDEINEKQENAYRYFKETIKEIQKEIEEKMEEHYQIKDVQVLTSKFTPTTLLFGRDGGCGIYVDDNDEEYGPYDDYDIGLAVSIIPEVKIYSQDEYAGYMFGGGGCES